MKNKTEQELLYTVTTCLLYLPFSSTGGQPFCTNSAKSIEENNQPQFLVKFCSGCFFSFFSSICRWLNPSNVFFSSSRLWSRKSVAICEAVISSLISNSPHEPGLTKNVSCRGARKTKSISDEVSTVMWCYLFWHGERKNRKF